MKTLTTEQIETLKTMDWQDDRGSILLYFTSTNDSYFQDITGVCVSCLRELLGGDNTIENFYWEIAYRFHKEGGGYDLHYLIWCKGEVVKDGVIQEFNTDVLGLFTKKEKTEEELFLDTIAGFVGEHDDEYIIDLLKQNCTDFWNKIVCDVVENLTVTDIDDSLKEDIARDWIDDNSGEAFDRAWDNMDSYDIKDKIIVYLSDNL